MKFRNRAHFEEELAKSTGKLNTLNVRGAKRLERPASPNDLDTDKKTDSSHWGPKENIHPSSVLTHKEYHQDDIEDYSHSRDQHGRVFQKVIGGKHDGKYLPTNTHESSSGHSPETSTLPDYDYKKPKPTSN